MCSLCSQDFLPNFYFADIIEVLFWHGLCLLWRRAYALYSPCRPSRQRSVCFRVFRPGTAAHADSTRYDWAGGQRRLSQKRRATRSGMRRLHCSLLPMKALTYEGAGRQARFPNRKELFVPRNGPGVWQRRIIPGRKLPRKPPGGAGSGGTKKYLWSSRSFFAPNPAIGSFIRKPVAGGGVNAAKRLPLSASRQG